MTSSLVGSEMCIRDRFLVLVVVVVVVVDRVAQGWWWWWCRTCLRKGGAVSYTHLTLPTICSV
eukprot:10014471-Prorocentrum_lima.AAC.1